MTTALTDPRIVKPISAEQAWAFIEDTKVKIRTQNWLYFDIGARLKVIRDQKLYLQIDGGYGSFDEFILQADIGFKRRSAYNYIELYEYYMQHLQLKESDVLKTPYWRLLELKRLIKDKPIEEAKEILFAQNELPTHEYKLLKKDKGLIEKTPRIFQTPTGKWTIEFYSSATHRITDIESDREVFHE